MTQPKLRFIIKRLILLFLHQINMKKLINIFSFLVLTYFVSTYIQNNLLRWKQNNADNQKVFAQELTNKQNSEQKLQEAFRNKTSNFQVQSKGIVTRILKDDLEGGKHQKFLLKLKSGQTLLISHNIDLAPRIVDLKVGDEVNFFGEYEWNEKGGVVHWTHHDPNGKHVNGWLKHKGKTYQ